MTSRLSEALEILHEIKKEESSRANTALTTSFALSLRGMMLVSLYGVLEYTITTGTQSLINYLSGLQIRRTHLEAPLHSLSLDAQLTSARHVGENKKWETRRAIFLQFASAEPCIIPDTVFGTFTHNVYPATVTEIFECFGIKKAPTSTPQEEHYFKEIKERRNAVAHGRETAQEVGRGYTAQTLEQRHNTTHSIASYFLDCIEEHAADLKFIKQEDRELYRKQQV
jgi:hypothetical protein